MCSLSARRWVAPGVVARLCAVPLHTGPGKPLCCTHISEDAHTLTPWRRIQTRWLAWKRGAAALSHMNRENVDYINFKKHHLLPQSSSGSLSQHTDLLRCKRRENHLAAFARTKWDHFAGEQRKRYATGLHLLSIGISWMKQRLLLYCCWDAVLLAGYGVDAEEQQSGASVRRQDAMRRRAR